MPVIGQQTQPVLVCVELTFEVVVRIRLDDEPLVVVAHLENPRLRNAPAVIAFDDHSREPLLQQLSLARREPWRRRRHVKRVSSKKTPTVGARERM
jgi:hypothetical protein